MLNKKDPDVVDILIYLKKNKYIFKNRKNAHRIYKLS